MGTTAEVPPLEGLGLDALIFGSLVENFPAWEGGGVIEVSAWPLVVCGPPPINPIFGSAAQHPPECVVSSSLKANLLKNCSTPISKGINSCGSGSWSRIACSQLKVGNRPRDRSAKQADDGTIEASMVVRLARSDT